MRFNLENLENLVYIKETLQPESIIATGGLTAEGVVVMGCAAVLGTSIKWP